MLTIRIAILSCLLATLTPAASAEASCIGDTTGPFTPWVCADAEAGTLYVNEGPLTVDAAASADGATASGTLRHPLGASSVSGAVVA